MNTIEKYSGNIYDLYNSKNHQIVEKLVKKIWNYCDPNENFAYYGHGQKRK